jgi:hypothetical protein
MRCVPAATSASFNAYRPDPPPSCYCLTINPKSQPLHPRKFVAALRGRGDAWACDTTLDVFLCLRTLGDLATHRLVVDYVGIRRAICNHRARISAHAAWVPGSDLEYSYKVGSWETQIYLLKLEFIQAKYRFLCTLAALQHMARHA